VPPELGLVVAVVDLRCRWGLMNVHGIELIFAGSNGFLQGAEGLAAASRDDA